MDDILYRSGSFASLIGSSLIGMDAELEEEEVDECEKSMVDRALQKPVVQNEAEAIVDSAPLATPLPFGR